MVAATQPPKSRYPSLLWVTYVYACLLVIFAAVILMGIGGFDFAHIAYETPGSPVMAIIVAALCIYAVPFVVRLQLSPLARLLSAIFSGAAPSFLVGYVMYLMSETMIADGTLALFGSIVLFILGVVSFAALDGPKALRFSKK
jgi:hypothetical protein